MSNTSSTTSAASSVKAFLARLGRRFVNLLQVTKTKVTSKVGRFIRKFGAREEVLPRLDDDDLFGDGIIEIKHFDTQTRREFEMIIRKHNRKLRARLQRAAKNPDKLKQARRHWY